MNRLMMMNKHYYNSLQGLRAFAIGLIFFSHMGIFPVPGFGAGGITFPYIKWPFDVY